MRAFPLLLASLAVPLIIAACTGGDGGSTPTPQTTGTPSPEAGEIEGFRTFASLLDEAIVGQDTGFFIDRILTNEITCSGDERVGSCIEQEAGTVLSGVYAAVWRTDAADLLTDEEFGQELQALLNEALPEEEDQYGSGGARLFALADGPPRVIADQQPFYAVVTAITLGELDPERRVVVYQLVSWNDRWRLYGQLEIGPLAEEWLSGDCADCYGQWERWEGPPQEGSGTSEPEPTASPSQ